MVKATLRAGASFLTVIRKTPASSVFVAYLLGVSAGLLGFWLSMSVEEKMAAHSSILTWRIPWTEEPGGLQSTGSQRVRQD